MAEENVEGWVVESLQGIIGRMFDLLIESENRGPVWDASERPPPPSLDQILGPSNDPYAPGFYVEGPGADQGVLAIQDIFNPLVLFLTTLGILLAAIRLLWSRRLDPMMDMIRGLLTVIVATFGGLFLILVLMRFGSGLTTMVLTLGTSASEGAEAQETFLSAAKSVYPSIMRVGADGNDLGFMNETARGALSSMVGLAVILGLIAQMIVLTLLDAVLYLIACLLPLAAASTMIPGLKIFPKVIGWLFACLLYKPLLMMIYLVGLVILGTVDDYESDGLLRYLLGAAIMLLATGSLPVLMRLMSSGGVWAMAFMAGGLNSITGGGGGGGGGDPSPSNHQINGSPIGSQTGGEAGIAQVSAAGANERAAGVARNLDGGGSGTGGGTAGALAGVSGSGTGAATASSLGTQGGQALGLTGTGTGGGGVGGAGGGTASGTGDGAEATASGATESSNSAGGGAGQPYSQAATGSADGASGSVSGGAAPGADTPSGAATDGGGSLPDTGGAYSGGDAASGAAPGADVPGGAVSAGGAPGGAATASDGGGAYSGGDAASGAVSGADVPGGAVSAGGAPGGAATASDGGGALPSGGGSAPSTGAAPPSLPDGADGRMV